MVKSPQKTRRRPRKIQSSELVREPEHLIILKGKRCASELNLERTCGCSLLISMLKSRDLGGTVLTGFHLSHELMTAAFRELDPERKKPNIGERSDARTLNSVDVPFKNAQSAAKKLGQNLDSAHILLSLLTSQLGSKKIRALLEKSGVKPDEVINRALKALAITKTQWDAAMPTQ